MQTFVYIYVCAHQRMNAANVRRRIDRGGILRVCVRNERERERTFHRETVICRNRPSCDLGALAPSSDRDPPASVLSQHPSDGARNFIPRNPPCYIPPILFAAHACTPIRKYIFLYIHTYKYTFSTMYIIHTHTHTHIK